jgi:hypothetical protein
MDLVASPEGPVGQRLPNVETPAASAPKHTGRSLLRFLGDPGSTPSQILLIPHFKVKAAYALSSFERLAILSGIQPCNWASWALALATEHRRRQGPA